MRSIWVIAVCVASFVVVEAFDNPRDIMEKVQKYGRSNSEQYTGLLTSHVTVNIQDKKVEKETQKKWMFERLGAFGQSKATIRFTDPPEVKGVALLIVNHPDAASDQWMWTPALERDRRIALQDRSTRFYGTDFSFEDLEERDVDQFDYQLLADELIGGRLCWKIQSTPKESKTSQYSHSYTWIRKDNFAVAVIESYRKNQLIRRLLNTNITNINGVWTPLVMTMHDFTRGTPSHTVLKLKSVKYDEKLKDDEFTLQALRHMK